MKPVILCLVLILSIAAGACAPRSAPDSQEAMGVSDTAPVSPQASPERARSSHGSPGSPRALGAPRARSIAHGRSSKLNSGLRVNYLPSRDVYEISLKGFSGNLIYYSVVENDRVVFRDTIQTMGSPIRWMLPYKPDRSQKNYLTIETNNQQWGSPLD